TKSGSSYGARTTSTWTAGRGLWCSATCRRSTKPGGGGGPPPRRGPASSAGCRARPAAAGLRVRRLPGVAPQLGAGFGSVLATVPGWLRRPDSHPAVGGTVCRRARGSLRRAVGAPAGRGDERPSRAGPQPKAHAEHRGAGGVGAAARALEGGRRRDVRGRLLRTARRDSGHRGDGGAVRERPARAHAARRSTFARLLVARVAGKSDRGGPAPVRAYRPDPGVGRNPLAATSVRQPDRLP